MRGVRPTGTRKKTYVKCLIAKRQNKCKRGRMQMVNAFGKKYYLLQKNNHQDINKLTKPEKQI